MKGMPNAKLTDTVAWCIDATIQFLGYLIKQLALCGAFNLSSFVNMFVEGEVLNIWLMIKTKYL